MPKHRRWTIAFIIVIVCIIIVVSTNFLFMQRKKVDDRFTTYMNTTDNQYVPLSKNGQTNFVWHETGTLTLKFDETTGPLVLSCTVTANDDTQPGNEMISNMELQKEITIPITSNNAYTFSVKSVNSTDSSGTVWFTSQFVPHK